MPIRAWEKGGKIEREKSALTQKSLREAVSKIRWGKKGGEKEIWREIKFRRVKKRI